MCVSTALQARMPRPRILQKQQVRNCLRTPKYVKHAWHEHQIKVFEFPVNPKDLATACIAVFHLLKTSIRFHGTSTEDVPPKPRCRRTTLWQIQRVFRIRRKLTDRLLDARAVRTGCWMQEPYRQAPNHLQSKGAMFEDKAVGHWQPKPTRLYAVLMRRRLR